METNTALIITLATLFFLVLLFILALIKTDYLSKDEKIRLYKQLDDIKFTLSTNSPSTNRDSIVRLDALLSTLLQTKFNNQAKCGDNIKRLKKYLNKKLYNQLWRYHKLRNDVVHKNIEISDSEAVEAFRVYSEILMKLIK